jgi:predicted metal-dependent hydrolase
MGVDNTESLRKSRGSLGASGQDTSDVQVEVRRSTRRRSTVTAFREGGKLVVAIPARFTRAQERHWVATMVARLEAKEAKRRPSDEKLLVRSGELSRVYLGSQAKPSSVRWVSTMRTRWGSCTVTDGSIRISDRIQTMPGYVLDYVLLHELAHLLHAGHGPQFWALLASYPHTDKARGFLDGVSHADRYQSPDGGCDAEDDGY